MSTGALLDELRGTADAVQRKDWLAAGLDGATAALDALGAVADPLSALSGAGFGFVAPFVSFLREPLHQLAGDPHAVSSGARSFHQAGQGVSGIADRYRTAATAETDDWSGAAADGYRSASAEHADGIAGLGQASTAVASAVSGAGEVVAQAAQIVTELVTEAVGQIVTIMTQAFASAAATFGGSVAAAIPQAVQVAVEHGQRIAEKLAALLASGQNLLKLVAGALAVVDTITRTLSSLTAHSTGGKSTTPSGNDVVQPGDAVPAT